MKARRDIVMVGLHTGGLITIQVGSLREKFFSPGDYEAMGDLLAMADRGAPVMCSSSVNHPAEYGFLGDFDLDPILDKARVHAYRKNSVRFESPRDGLGEALIALFKGRGYPLSVLFVKAGRHGRLGREDVLLVFEEEKDAEYFVAGARFTINHADPVPQFDPEHDLEARCAHPMCDHTYERHFDTYNKMEPVGCKYCGCPIFIEPGSPAASDVRPVDEVPTPPRSRSSSRRRLPRRSKR